MLKRVITVAAIAAWALAGPAEAAEVKLTDDKTLSLSAEHGTYMWTDDAPGTPQAEVIWRDGSVVSREKRVLYGRVGSDATGQVKRLTLDCNGNGADCTVFSQPIDGGESEPLAGGFGRAAIAESDGVLAVSVYEQATYVRAPGSDAIRRATTRWGDVEVDGTNLLITTQQGRPGKRQIRLVNFSGPKSVSRRIALDDPADTACNCRVAHRIAGPARIDRGYVYWLENRDLISRKGVYSGTTSRVLGVKIASKRPSVQGFNLPRATEYWDVDGGKLLYNNGDPHFGGIYLETAPQFKRTKQKTG